jgi:putative membrane protein
MMRLLLRWAVAAIAIFVAVKFLPGLHFRGSLLSLAGVAAIWGLVNALVRPVLKLLTCPLIILTLGLFTLIINAAMLLLTSWFAEGFGIHFAVDDFWAAFWGALVISIVSFLLNLLIGEAESAE